MSDFENRCKARGCERCCWNTFLGMSRGNFDLFKGALEQRGVNVERQSRQSFQSIQGLTTNSPGDSVVVFCEDKNRLADVLVQIVRKCPALADGNCGLIGDPARPLGCEHLVYNGSKCEIIFSGGFTCIAEMDIE